MVNQPEHPVTKLLSELKLTIAERVGGNLDMTAELIIETIADIVNQERDNVLESEKEGDRFLFIFKDLSYIEFRFYKDSEDRPRVEYNVGMTTLKDSSKH